MNTAEWDIPLMAAGREIADAGHLVRRHLGMTSPAEQWAAPLYDCAARTNDAISDADLLATAALGVRITSGTLADFAVARPQLEQALAGLPSSVSLTDADDRVLEQIRVALTGTGLEPTMAAKLLHRARPRLVPPYDRAISDWYARGFGDRESGRLPQLLHRLRHDLRQPANQASLCALQQLIATEADGALVPSRLRLFDIAVWMAATVRH